jgi:hypothetical protein
VQVWSYRDHRGDDREVTCTSVGIHSSGALLFFVDPEALYATRLVAPGRWIDCVRIDDGPDGGPIAAGE